jgi:N,N'-diacetyllegionaminate synthase
MVFVIAEAGVNHNGNINIAHKLIDAAKYAGANAVKFQTFSAEKLEPPGERRDMLKRLELTHEQHAELKAHADQRGIEFMSTPFDVESLSFLVGLGVKRIKIASGQRGNHPLIKAAVDSGLPLIISLGMGSHAGVTQNATWLHCVSAYPAPVEDTNLRAMQTLPAPYGLSDHSQNIMLPSLAVAMGATVIERHITLDRNMAGPDHHMSTEPDQFKTMVDFIRWTEVALGDGIKRLMPSELATKQIIDERTAWRVSQ